MYFLQKDDIMLHFTLSGSSDITDYQCLLSCLLLCLLFVYLKSGGRFKFEFKFGFKIEFEFKYRSTGGQCDIKTLLLQ